MDKLKIAITIIHNKPGQQNNAQIAQVLNFITLNEEVKQTPDIDENGNPIIRDIIEYTYTAPILGDIPHEVRFFQIVPYGGSKPNDWSLLMKAGGCGGVLYGEGDNDKVGNHPRFFNWGFKRAVDYGADISIYLDDLKKLKLQDLPFIINSLEDPTDPLDFYDLDIVAVHKRQLRKGQLDETKGIDEAFVEYKGRQLNG